MKILNFGSCNIDCVYSVENIACPGETVPAFGLEHFAGGKGLNQSIALARAGAEVFHAGCIGEDGQMLRKLLRDSGVNLKYLKTVENRTGQAVIQVDAHGENSILLYSGANYAVTRDYIDEVLNDFSAGDFLLIQNEISELPYLIEMAYAAGMRIIFNPSPFQQTLRNIDLNQVSYLILNEIEAAGFSGLSEPEEFVIWSRMNYPDTRVILTLGKNGSIYFDGQTRIKQNAFCVKAVDTTAAGDTFTGYFAAGIFSGKSVEKSLRLASCAAAIAVSRKGAAPSVPTMEEVKESLETMQLCACSDIEQKKRTVKAYFENHLSDATLGGLAAQLGYCPSYTGRWLKNNIGASFSELLLSARCRTLAALLKETELCVSELIARTGYNNESFMRKAFYREYGCTPLEYRKRKQDEKHDK